jgi:hypothetical protein
VRQLPELGRFIERKKVSSRKNRLACFARLNEFTEAGGGLVL